MSARAEAACQLQTIAEFPVTMERLRPMVSVKINGQDARFFIDSGAFFSTITANGAAKLGLKLGPAPFGMYVIGAGKGEAQVQVATAKDVFLANQLVHNIDFLVVDGGLGGEEGGVIGQNVLHNADVEYDLADGVVRLFRPNGCGYAPLAYWATDTTYTDIPIEAGDLRSPHTRGEVSVNGERVRALFDTGSPRSILSTAAAARAGVKAGMPGVEALGVSSGIAARSYFRVWRGTFASFKIGGEEVRNTPLDFGDIGDNQDEDMLIGADFFLSHRILVSNSQHRMYFTYNGGPVFNIDRPLPPVASASAPIGAAPTADAGSPKTADDFARRAAASMSMRAYPAAIADWTQALKLAPSDGHYTLERARAELANRQPLLALADVDETLTLKPGDIDAYLTRADLAIAMHDPGQAAAALKTADGLAEKAPDAFYDIAFAHERVGGDVAAIADLSRWLDAHPVDDRRAEALNTRCWLRALTNVDLDKALADCEGALKLAPGDPAYLDSRGLAHLRRGELDAAVADYRAALKVRPDTAWSLYGKGLAELRKGQDAQGHADLQTALTIDPTLADRAKTYGLTP
ncbi:MAG TPA: aspartyl protease family protein [Caulobacteraceae bacterium]|nr:aspartyl protease family protein [Caulobacteraceae bacterium]